jgi:uncharacterized protein
MANPVVHWEVVGRDGPGLQRFYGELFGWNVQNHPEMNYGIVEAQDGTGIGGGIGQSPDGGGHVTFYVAVDDPQAYLDRAEQLGGRTVVGVTEMPMVTLALLADPEGHVVGVVKNQ